MKTANNKVSGVNDCKDPPIALSDREAEIIALTAQGKTRGEISSILSISAETVKAHLKKICAKLQATSKMQAAIRALALGLINLDKD